MNNNQFIHHLPVFGGFKLAFSLNMNWAECVIQRLKAIDTGKGVPVKVLQSCKW
jgi:hypothetical protein